MLQSARLNLQGEHGLRPWTSWSAEKLGTQQLLLRTAAPATVWIVEPGPDALRVSSTSTRAVLTAEAPAPADRVVARLLDPAGFPVDWVGTAEVASTDTAGARRDTRLSSPRGIADVMYFALGQVSASTLHGLFDRKSDTAIRFSDETLMERDPRDPDRLDLDRARAGNTQVRVLPDYYQKTLGFPSTRPSTTPASIVRRRSGAAGRPTTPT